MFNETPPKVLELRLRALGYRGREMTTATLRFDRVGTTMVLSHTEREPSAQEWSAWLRAMTAAIRAHGVRGAFVVTRGGGPNGLQRAEAIRLLTIALGDDVPQMKVAVCSDSPIARGITTALLWLTQHSGLKMFGYDDRVEALTFLGVPQEQRPEILSLAERFEAELETRALGRAGPWPSPR